ncbi:MAG: IS110 family transposase [Sulfobacillus acidophilus]|uniref:IS110 family transposase n=1 Tax=Sulfobacillus acidophilus TaxID=53633 RepID=A0A2T2WI63_9FIRM|nr:MAG: IS110 family transposase [Sulfobacillus acidophilus]
MDVVFPRCAGLDVHKKSVVACVAIRGGGTVSKEVRTFGTTTRQLHALRAWLQESGVTQVAMESTASYWKPVFNLLEAEFTPWVVNPAHIKQVPGRKTDVKDAEWIADLLQHGLLKPSFIPDRAQRELRELTRYRTSLLGERAREVNRIQKVLEGGNIKISSVLSDILGVSGTRMLQALADGESDPVRLAALADERVRATPEALQEALEGLMDTHQRFLLHQQWAHLAALDRTLAAVDAEVAERLRPFGELLRRLQTIPGVGRRTAEVILAEIGPTVRAFRTASALAAWIGVAPGNKESAGKRLSGQTRKGNKALRAALVEAAHAAGRTKATYLGAQYRRAVRTKGRKRAAVMVAHSMAVSLWHMMHNAEDYVDLGVDYFDRRDVDQAKRQAVQRLERLGFTVQLTEAAS